MPLIDSVWPRHAGIAWFRGAALTLVGVVLLTTSAKIKVPFYPVPMTMQTFIVLVIGVAYGWRLAAVTLLLYLAAGAFGLPVFADTPEKGVGVPYMLGPTGGYLVGFLAAATLVGRAGMGPRGRVAVRRPAARSCLNLCIRRRLACRPNWSRPSLECRGHTVLSSGFAQIRARRGRGARRVVVRPARRGSLGVVA